jgi:acetylornithine/succinyldiaminopimelate/putrescine aminotransferase
MNTAKSRNPQSPTMFRPLALASGAKAAAQPGLSDLLKTFHADAVYERAEGDYLFQRKGAALLRVLDLIGGFGTNLLGHNHPDILDELRRLIDERVPFSAQVSSRPGQMELESRLRERLGAYRLIVTNSGAETIEAALKHAFLERRQDTFWAQGSFSRSLGRIFLG